MGDKLTSSVSWKHYTYKLARFIDLKPNKNGSFCWESQQIYYSTNMRNPWHRRCVHGWKFNEKPPLESWSLRERISVRERGGGRKRETKQAICLVHKVPWYLQFDTTTFKMDFVERFFSLLSLQIPSFKQCVPILYLFDIF